MQLRQIELKLPRLHYESVKLDVYSKNDEMNLHVLPSGRRVNQIQAA